MRTKLAYPENISIMHWLLWLMSDSLDDMWITDSRVFFASILMYLWIAILAIKIIIH